MGLRNKLWVFICILNLIMLVVAIAYKPNNRIAKKPVKISCITVANAGEVTLKEPKPVNKETLKRVKKEKKSKWKTLGVFKCTTYCPCEQCCGEYSNNRTSTGVIPKEGRTIAVDPSIIPYGTKVLIGGNEYIAEDCGGMIKGKHIDIYYSSHSKALKVGTKNLEVKVENK